MCVDGRFHTRDCRAQFVPIGERGPANATDSRYPLALNTGRIRDQWHTMTRTARAPRLTAHLPEPYVELHPADAEQLGLTNGALAQVTSRQGKLLGRAQITDTQRPGSVFVPMHWSDRFALQGRADALTDTALDPVSGQPEFKHTPVRVEAFRPHWEGFVLSRTPVDVDQVDYRTRIPDAGFVRYELAGVEPPRCWQDWARG